jgi:hypothetical protein
VERNYSWDKIAEDMEGLYLAVMAKGTTKDENADEG